MKTIIALLLFGAVSTVPAIAEDKTFRGNAMPFEIIAAVRNFAFRDGPAAQVVVSVVGGTQADWLATAAYVAEQSIVADVTFATVDVYVPSPWGDKPPQNVKQLAKAYYAGPDPSRSPWPDRPWDLFAASHAPSLPNVEYVELKAELSSHAKSQSGDADKAEAALDRRARGMIIRKYHLPKSWKPDEHLGSADLDSVQTTRDHIVIGSTQAAAASIAKLKACLVQEGPGLFKGCQDVSEDYSFRR